jgi:uncharacterized protein involved in type VI secretion and phage assembly
MNPHESNGIVIGLVTSLKDETGLRRVKVSYPHLGDGIESTWARIATPMAGNKRGCFFRPEVNDEVLVAFEHGDPRRPYIIGALWSEPDAPPPDDGKQEENNWRFIRSRSGHVFKLNDTKDAETIELIDKDEQRMLIIDSPKGKIQIICLKGDVEILVKSGHVQITAESGNVNVKAVNVAIKADQKLSLSAGSTVEIDGKAGVKISSSAQVEVQGSLIKLN